MDGGDDIGELGAIAAVVFPGVVGGEIGGGGMGELGVFAAVVFPGVVGGEIGGGGIIAELLFEFSPIIGAVVDDGICPIFSDILNFSF